MSDRNWRAGPHGRLVTKSEPRSVSFHPHTPLTLLGVVFVILKLTHVIDWSWWWVTAPFWALAVLVVGVLATFSILTAWEKR